MPKYAANPEPIQRIRTLPDHIVEADEGRGGDNVFGARARREVAEGRKEGHTGK
jgi:hypothetical protein